LRFDLIDRVVEQDADRLVAVKAVSVAEEYLADHFPGFAVLPGVMMLESLVQGGRALLADRADGQPLVLAEAKNVRYGRMVRPGQHLRVEVSLRKQTAHGWQLEGKGTVADQPAVQARIVLEPLARQLDTAGN
jgi:3-hydroxyacyl-[acyl-carrier-protein] dehydratase